MKKVQVVALTATVAVFGSVAIVALGVLFQKLLRFKGQIRGYREDLGT